MMKGNHLCGLTNQYPPRSPGINASVFFKMTLPGAASVRSHVSNRNYAKEGEGGAVKRSNGHTLSDVSRNLQSRQPIPKKFKGGMFLLSQI